MGSQQKPRSHTATCCTCILVFTTSRGVLPKTLAAPAMAPNIPVTKGFMTLLGSSPGKKESDTKGAGGGKEGGERHKGRAHEHQEVGVCWDVTERHCM